MHRDYNLRSLNYYLLYYISFVRIEIIRLEFLLMRKYELNFNERNYRFVLSFIYVYTYTYSTLVRVSSCSYVKFRNFSLTWSTLRKMTKRKKRTIFLKSFFRVSEYIVILTRYSLVISYVTIDKDKGKLISFLRARKCDWKRRHLIIVLFAYIYVCIRI